MSALHDANVTIGAWPAGGVNALDVPTLVAQMDRLGISSATVRHSDALHYDPQSGNERLVALTADQPRLRRALVLGPLDCGEHGRPDGLVRLLDRHRAVAVWLYPRSHGWSMTGPEAQTLLTALADSRRPVYLDLDETDWTELDQLAARLPANDIVVCGVGYRTLRQAFVVLSRQPRVRVDTSFLSAHNGLELIATRFGAHRLVFGTNSPVRDAAAAVYRLARSGLTKPEQDSIAGAAGPQDQEALPPARFAAVPAGGVVDAHAHIGHWPTSYTPAAAPADLIAGMDRVGTAISVASSMRAIWSGEVGPGNAEMLAAARDYPGRLYVHVVANPHHEQDRDQLEELLQCNEVRGIKVHPHTHSCAADDARYDWIYRLAARRDVPVLVHTFAGTWHSDPRQLGAVAARHPDVAILAGHCGATPEGFAATIDVASQHPNVYAEICGTAMTGWWLRRLVDALGAERVVHGTDATLIDARYGVGRVLGAELSDADRALILAGNARRLFRLNDSIV